MTLWIIDDRCSTYCAFCNSEISSVDCDVRVTSTFGVKCKSNTALLAVSIAGTVSVVDEFVINLARI